MLTANTESYIYLSYISWFLTGIIVNIVMERYPATEIPEHIPALTTYRQKPVIDYPMEYD